MEGAEGEGYCSGQRISLAELRKNRASREFPCIYLFSVFWFRSQAGLKILGLSNEKDCICKWQAYVRKQLAFTAASASWIRLLEKNLTPSSKPDHVSCLRKGGSRKLAGSQPFLSFLFPVLGSQRRSTLTSTGSCSSEWSGMFA